MGNKVQKMEEQLKKEKKRRKQQKIMEDCRAHGGPLTTNVMNRLYNFVGS